LSVIVDGVSSIRIATMDSLTLLRQDVDLWNQWRAVHPKARCQLTEVNLSRGYFFEGNFSGADLSGTDLRRACLIGANFRYANLTGADLSEAYLVDADFTGANLHEAKLLGAHVERASFGRAIGLSEAQWKSVAKARELTAAAGQTKPGKAIGKWSRRQPVSDGNVYDPGISGAIARLGLGPVAHERKLMRMLTSAPLSHQTTLREG